MSGVNRELRPVPTTGQAIRDDLNATRIAKRNINVHVSEPDVAGSAPNGRALDANTTDVVAPAERWSPSWPRRPWHTTSAQRQGERQTQPPQEHPEVFGGRETAADTGRTVKARPECESSSARDAGLR